ncbi:hypothetical protein [Formosa sp. 4Alg 33]|uniref:hypothetical protein n=1 Tax=Formosa sp. 4Alg 33 TaxID=3382189 RepID=UPI003D9C6202
MPANLKNTNEVIKILPKDKVYILDQMHPELSQYSAIYQNFEKDIYNNLTEAIPLILKYSQIILHFSVSSQPLGMKKGFIEFCKVNSLEYKVISSLKDRVITKGELYVLPEDKNLLRVIKGMKR